MTESWGLQAIEKEAEARAMQKMLATPDYMGFVMFGLSVRQIRALMEFYEKHTGKTAYNVCEP